MRVHVWLVLLLKGLKGVGWVGGGGGLHGAVDGVHLAMH